MIITIDGPAGSGKSTIARLLSEKLDLPIIYSGLFYRALASFVLLKRENSQEVFNSSEEYLELISSIETVEMLADSRVLVEGLDVTPLLRTREVDDLSSKISQAKIVRDKVTELINKSTSELSSFIAEGRDMGSVVFKGADLKIYLDASITERARRRYLEILQDRCISFSEVLEDISERDKADSNRVLSPLTIPEGAHIIDTTEMELPDVVEAIISLINSKQ